jgi:hypothetical protein
VLKQIFVLIFFLLLQYTNSKTMIYANHLYNLATSKPRISMAEIEAACIDKAKQGELCCWVFNPIAEKDIQRLRMNGFKVEKHSNLMYLIDWSNPTNI